MKSQLWTNNTGRTVYRAGMRFPPGETRELPAHLIPSSSASKPVEYTSGDLLDPLFAPEDFLKLSLRDMEDVGIAGLKLADLDVGQLNELKRLENDDQNRTNVLTAVDAALLKAAQQSRPGNHCLDAIEDDEGKDSPLQGEDRC